MLATTSRASTGSLSWKSQPVAQCQSPDQPILLDLMSLDHLRLGGPVHIDAIERVEDEISLIARRAEADDDRIEHAEIFGRNKDQLVGPLRASDPRRSERGNARADGRQQVSSPHPDFLPIKSRD
jgi:hypothetical protein